MFDYVNEILNNKDKKEEISKTIKIDIQNNIRLNADAIKHMDFDKIPDNEIYNMCLNDFDEIMESLRSDEKYIIKLMNTPKFVINLSQALYSLKPTEQQKTLLCNTIYVIRNKEKEKSSNSMLLLNLGKIVNRDIVPRLIGVGFSEDESGEICIARYSSMKEMIQVKRINKYITNYHKEIKAETVIKVYETLGYFSHFMHLFEGIIYDANTLPENTTATQKENYAVINLALVDILEEMPSDLLLSLLLSFAEERYMYPDYNIRFNLNSCSVTDFPRLNNMILYIKQNYSLEIPYL